MSNKITSGVSKHLPQSTDQAIQLITALTGESPSNLAKLPIEEIITILCKLLQTEREKVEALLESHDQNQELDTISLAHLWKLVSRKIIPNKKQKFGALPDKAFEEVMFLNARKMDETRYRIQNNLGPATSGYMTSIPAKQAPAASVSSSTLAPVMHRLSVALAANSNLPGISRGSAK